MRIKKVINNNILCAIDEKGNEMIVTGKGLGFKRNIGEFIDETQIQKIYRMEQKSYQRKLRELIEQIPIEHLELTELLVEQIKKEIRQPLNESLVITLADHISFAIQRKEKGIEFSNPLKESIMCYYPTEYRLGEICLDIVEKEYHISLHPDEASFIAHHIVNAELNTSMWQIQEITKLLDGCVRVTEFFYRIHFDRNSLDFNRFIVHLRYLAHRLYQGQMLTDSGNDSDQMFHELIKRNCEEHYQCACRIASYIETNYDKTISEEEKIYITIHLKRLNTKEE